MFKTIYSQMILNQGKQKFWKENSEVSAGIVWHFLIIILSAKHLDILISRYIINQVNLTVNILQNVKIWKSDDK